jgi:uncharacterized flavoprotein (TIGR03862 family)
MKTKKIGIVGTGPAALMAGTRLVENGFEVQFFDQKKAAARKFLVAGNGGFNLTNSEGCIDFIEKYDHDFLKNAVKNYTNEDFISFLNKIGIPTYVGSSGKIFPERGIKPIEVLQNWLNELTEKGAEFYFDHQLIDFDPLQLTLQFQNNSTHHFDSLVFALGGASWGKTGSDGSWQSLFQSKSIACLPFQASNSGIVLDALDSVKEFEGEIIKNCAVFSKVVRKEGDLVITKYGIEGAPIYAVNKSIRDGLKTFIDFKPMLTFNEVLGKIQASKNTTEGLKNLKLPKSVLSMIKDSIATREEYLDVKAVANRVKNFPLIINGFRPIDEVISTVGGLDMNEISDQFQVVKHPSVYCIGEMLNWDAPTGGYLIQGAVSSGYAAAESIINLSSVN